MLLNIIQEIEKYEKEEIERIAVDTYTPLKEAVYIWVDQNMQASTVDAEDIKWKDYFSNLISTNKSVDSKKIIQSNNKFSVFVRNFEKLNESILGGYYAALDAEEEGEKYKKWILDNLDFLKEKSGGKLVKVFFNASMEEYAKEGRKYFLSKIFADMNKVVECNGEILGAPVCNLMNPKKPYSLFSANGKTNGNSTLYTKEEAYKVKCFFDILKAYARMGNDKLYISDGKMIPVKRGELLKKRLSGCYYMHFCINSKGSLEINEFDCIAGYKADERIDQVYGKISFDFFDGKLYGLLIDTNGMDGENINEKQKILAYFKQWFILGNPPSSHIYIKIIRKNLVKIAQRELAMDCDLDIRRIYTIKYLDDLFGK